MARRTLLPTLLALAVTTGCSDPKLKVGLNVGLAGADVGSLAASEIRMSKVASDRRFDVRIAAQRSLALGELTPQMLSAALDSFVTDDKVAVVLSRFMNAEEMAAAQRYKAAGMPFLSVSPLPDDIATADGPGFSLVPTLAAQARFLAAQARADDRVAIVHIDDVYGTSLAAELTKALQARGIKTADVRSYAQSWDEPRMVALGTELERTTDPSLMYFLGRAPSLALVWQPFRDVAKEIRVIGSDLVESVAIYENPEGIFTHLRYVRYLDPQSKDERMHDLHERYAIWLGRGEMTGEGVLVYDGMQVVGEAVRSGARTRDEFRKFLASLGKTRPPFNGVGGPIEFGESGDVARPFQLAEVTTTGVVTVEDVAAAAPAATDSQN